MEKEITEFILHNLKQDARDDRDVVIIFCYETSVSISSSGPVLLRIDKEKFLKENEKSNKITNN